MYKLREIFGLKKKEEAEYAKKYKEMKNARITRETVEDTIEDLNTICSIDANYRVVNPDVTIAETQSKRIQGTIIERVGNNWVTKEEKDKAVDAFRRHGLEIIDEAGSKRIIMSDFTKEDFDNPYSLVPENSKTLTCHTLLVCSKDDIPILNIPSIKKRCILYYP